MNKNDECDIIRDLAVTYVENLVNDRSKIFIEEHLEKCDKCRKYYNEMNSDLFNETKDEEEYELNFLKKIRKNMNILKITLFAILIIIIIIIIGILLKYQSNTQVINKAYDRIQYLKTLDNYKLIEKNIDIDYEKNTIFETLSETYYKDGKYKVDLGEIIYYYEDNSHNEINVYKDLRQIDYNTKNYIDIKKGNTFNVFSDIIAYKTELPGLMSLYRTILSKRVEMYKGIECYVIKVGNDSDYREIWLEKYTYNILRVIQSEKSKKYRETTYTLLENEVTDKDVDSSILETEEYTEYTKNYTTYNVPIEIKKIYERN